MRFFFHYLCAEPNRENIATCMYSSQTHTGARRLNVFPRDSMDIKAWNYLRLAGNKKENWVNVFLWSLMPFDRVRDAVIINNTKEKLMKIFCFMKNYRNVNWKETIQDINPRKELALLRGLFALLIKNLWTAWSIPHVYILRSGCIFKHDFPQRGKIAQPPRNLISRLLQSHWLELDISALKWRHFQPFSLSCRINQPIWTSFSSFLLPRVVHLRMSCAVFQDFFPSLITERFFGIMGKLVM